MKICKVDGCKNKHIAKGFCDKHYKKFTKYGNPLYVFKLPIGCKIDGCNSKHKGLGYCKKHYRRFKKYGDPMITYFSKDRESHGMENTPEYDTWQNMRVRCYDKNNKAYKDYGGRGIKVCDKWRYSFIAFYEDMGSKPFPKAQIDREENNGNYEPDNCRWVTPTVNANNKRNSRKNKELTNGN